MKYAAWAAQASVQDGFRITWQVVPYFVDQLSLNRADLAETYTITVAQGLPNRVQSLEILGPPTDSVKAIRVYAPPGA